MEFCQAGLRPVALAGLLVASVVGCGRAQASPEEDAPPASAPAPIEVGVIELAPVSVTFTTELPGRVSPLRTAEVRARVDGVVQTRLFEEGSVVEKGAVLYRIEPRAYQASLASSKASLARAKATVVSAKATVDRYEKLLPTHAISGQVYDQAVADLHAYQADVASAQAAIDTAKIDLDYTRVVSPIRGRISFSQTTEGAYVQASAATLMATVQQTDEVYVDVTRSSVELLRLRRAVDEGQLELDDDGRVKVQLLLDDGSDYAQEGVFQTMDVAVNETTSTVTLRAIFPNPEGMLRPGQFVRARVVDGRKDGAIVVPQLAVTRDLAGAPLAFVLRGDGTIEQRKLTVPRALGNQWVVEEGLAAGDRLIVDNFAKVRAGIPAVAVEADLPEAYLYSGATKARPEAAEKAAEKEG